MKRSLLPAVATVSIMILLSAHAPTVSSSSSANKLIFIGGTIAYAELTIRRMLFDGVPGFTVQDYSQKADMYMCHFDNAWRVPRIHALNPDVICLLYRNIRAVKPRYTEEYQLFLENGWILRDANGVIINSTVFGYSIVDVGNPDYQAWVANWMKTYLDQYGYDGAYLDNCLPSTEIMWSTSPGPPINPRTGNPWTSEEFKQAVIALVNKVQDTIGSRPVIGNGIYNGERFFTTYRHQAYVDLLTKSEIDGILSEAWLMDGSIGEWYSEEKWLKSIEFVFWLENNFLEVGKLFLPICPNAGPYDGDGTPVLPQGCTKEQYALYCFSSLLLVAQNSKSYYMNFGYYVDSYADNLFDIDLGNPLNDYYMVNGTHVYARDFSEVKVLVNPTYSSYTVSLEAKYETFDGKPVTSPIIVEPHSGIILKKL